MYKRIKQLAISTATAGLIVATWFLGWYLYDQQEIWRTMANTTYQNLLTGLLGAITIFSMIAIIKVKQPLTDLDKKEINRLFTEATNKLTPEVDDLKTKQQEISKNLMDLKLAIKTKPEELNDVNKKLTELENKINKNITIEEKLKALEKQVNQLENAPKVTGSANDKPTEEKKQ